MGQQEVVGRWRRWLLLGRCRGGKGCHGEAIELPRQHVLLHQMADLVDAGLVLLDGAHHHLEAVPRRRRRAHYPGGDAVVAGNQPRNLGMDRLALLAGSVYEMLIQRGDVAAICSEADGSPRAWMPAHAQPRPRRASAAAPSLRSCADRA